MIVLRKINNNVAICRDGNQRELIAFGKGIGFPATPYELTDLRKVERTFYNVSSQYIPLLDELPPEIVRFTANQLQEIQDKLPYETNSNLVLSLSDHIAFAIERQKKGIAIQLPSVYEMELSYPLEIQVGKKIVAAARREFKVKLPRSEVQGVAMHLINARAKFLEEAEPNIEQEYEDILEQTTQIVEWEMGVRVRRDTFSYARFATHVQYLLKRIFQKKHIESSNLMMYRSIREEYPQASACVDKIGECCKNNWDIDLTEEEKMYLIMHVNRVCSKDAI